MFSIGEATLWVAIAVLGSHKNRVTEAANRLRKALRIEQSLDTLNTLDATDIVEERIQALDILNV